MCKEREGAVSSGGGGGVRLGTRSADPEHEVMGPGPVLLSPSLVRP